MSCSSCFKDFLVKCNTTITLYIGLAALPAYESYQWVITDKFDHKYSGELTEADVNIWTIDVADLPDGFLTQYAGNFILEIFKGEQQVNFTVCQRTSCIEFDIHAGTQVKDSLGSTLTSSSGIFDDVFE